MIRGSCSFIGDLLKEKLLLDEFVPVVLELLCLSHGIDAPGLGRRRGTFDLGGKASDAHLMSQPSDDGQVVFGIEVLVHYLLHLADLPELAVLHSLANSGENSVRVRWRCRYSFNALCLAGKKASDTTQVFTDKGKILLDEWITQAGFKSRIQSVGRFK
jgi:hypothetical protein